MSPSTIYAAFSWSCAEDAYQATLRLAEKHRLGFFDLTDLGTVWMPDEAGKLHVVYRGEDYPDFWQFE